MKTLPEYWFVESPIDREHKQYILWDFLKGVKEDFSLLKVYPSLGEILQQITSLETFKMKKKIVQDRVRIIKGFNWSTMEIEYEDINDDTMAEVDSIVDYSLHTFYEWKRRGSEIYDEVERNMEWRCLGIIPNNYVDEGYFIIRVDQKNIYSFRYEIKKVIIEKESVWGINCRLVDEQVNKKFKTLESVKGELIEKFPDLPVPLTMSIETKSYPMEESILPIVKRLGLIRIRRGIYS